MIIIDKPCIKQDEVGSALYKTAGLTVVKVKA
jgi:hypothetical protein